MCVNHTQLTARHNMCALCFHAYLTPNIGTKLISRYRVSKWLAVLVKLLHLDFSEVDRVFSSPLTDHT